MKIVVLSDVHSNLDALRAVIKNFPKYHELWCLGDIVGYGPQPNEVIEVLQGLRPTIVLMGNHDQAVVTGNVEGFSPHAAKAVKWTREVIGVENRRYLATLKSSARAEREGKAIALYHGSPRDPLTEYVFPDMGKVAGHGFVVMAGAKILLLGHTHVPMLFRFNGNLLANPGSVGQPRDGDPRASFALLTIAQDQVAFEVQRVEYDMGIVADRIIKSGLPGFLAERLYMGV
jgi:putative phosphoesterase